MNLNKIDKYMIIIALGAFVIQVIGFVSCILYDDILYYYILAGISFTVLYFIPLIYIVDKVEMISNRLSMNRIKVDK